MDRSLTQRQIASMERPTKAMLVAIAIVAAIAITLYLWVWLEPACSSDYRRILMKAAGGVGCFEFWLNRYQGLLGSMITAGVAGLTLLWVARQLAAANRQAFVAASEAMKTLARNLDEEKQILVKCAEDTIRQFNTLRKYLYRKGSRGSLRSAQIETDALNRQCVGAGRELNAVAERTQLTTLLAFGERLTGAAERLLTLKQDLVMQADAIDARWDDYTPLAEHERERAAYVLDEVSTLALEIRSILHAAIRDVDQERLVALRRAREFIYAAANG